MFINIKRLGLLKRRIALQRISECCVDTTLPLDVGSPFQQCFMEHLCAHTGQPLLCVNLVVTTKTVLCCPHCGSARQSKVLHLILSFYLTSYLHHCSYIQELSKNLKVRAHGCCSWKVSNQHREHKFKPPLSWASSVDLWAMSPSSVHNTDHILISQDELTSFSPTQQSAYLD